ncbi:MAG TPA: metal-dependent hydrolase [Micromonosporaceae bacterium]
MMGPSHALSGAAVWLAGSWALDYYNVYHQTPLELAVGAAVCAGGALLPDLDMSGKVVSGEGGATVANTFGRVSLFLAEVVEKLSLGVYTLTRMRDDPDRDNGHRTLTHTLPFTVGVGVLTTWACSAGGSWAVIGILFVMLGLALRGLFHTWAEKAGWVMITALSGVAAFGTYLFLPADRGYPMLGLAVGVGCFVHLLGDVITSAGVPILWPLPTGRRMWRMIGVPNIFAVSVGGKVERIVLRGLFTVISIAATLGLIGPALLEKFQVRL